LLFEIFEGTFLYRIKKPRAYLSKVKYIW